MSQATLIESIAEPLTDEVLEPSPRHEGTVIANDVIPISVEVVANHRNETQWRRYLYAVETLFTRANPSFLSVADVPFNKGPVNRYLTPAIDAGPADKVTPVIKVDGAIADLQLANSMHDHITYMNTHGIGRAILLPGFDPSEARMKSPPGDTSYLIDLVKATGKVDQVGVVVRPDRRLRSLSAEAEYDWVATQLEVADFAVTRPLASSVPYSMLLREMERRHITTPVIPGIMVFDDYVEYTRAAADGTVNTSEELQRKLRSTPSSSEAHFKVIGEYFLKLASLLMERGAPALHLYSQNNANRTVDTVNAIRQTN